MKTPGIIGGIAPESTIQYYRLMISSYRERKGDGSYPSILINSIDMKRMLDLIGAKDLTGMTDYLVDEVEKLARAGGHSVYWLRIRPTSFLMTFRRGPPSP